MSSSLITNSDYLISLNSGANTLSIAGTVAITGNLSVTGNATLSGNILGDRIQNGTTSIDIQTINGNANVTVGGTSNVAVFAATGAYVAGVVSATGNISGSYFVGNGSQLTGVTGTYGNANVVANLAALGSNPISTTGNITAGNLDAVNLVINSISSDDSSFVTIEDGLNVVGDVDVSGDITANNVSLTGNGVVLFTSGSTLTFGDTPVTNRYYVDATRTDTYTPDGSQARPFNTIATAQSAIATAIAGGLNPEVEPVYIILLSNVTENVTLATNHVYLIGQNGQIHQPIILAGNVIVQPTSGTLNSNHFSISGIEVVGGLNGKAVYVTGTYPTRLSLQDVWITANGNSAAGLYQDNSGTGTYTHGGPIKISHNGVGDVYCFDIRAGTASFDTVETSGATQVGAAGPGATLTFNNSQLEANGDVVVETYGNGVVVVTNSVIKNAAANSYGIKLNAVANVAGTVSVGQSAFNVPLGTGQAVWLDPNTTPGLSGVFAWGGATFYPGTNTTIAPLVIPGPLATLVGTIASPILYGDITSYSVAQDWDLVDNNASALSFDTTGKTGVLELVTTNSAEGVKMSGYANVVGNITGGNVSTAGVVKTGSFVTGTIPTAAGAGAGARAFVTDADSVTFGNLYVGGAANAMPVWSNGTSWYVG